MTTGSANNVGSGDTKLGAVIGYLLIAGVVTSMVLEVIGIILFYGTYGNTQISQNKEFFISGENFFAFVVVQTQHLFGSQNALLFMTVGIIVLLLTPYIRVITSLIYFGWERNRKYVAITLFVLLVLTVSLALH